MVLKFLKIIYLLLMGASQAWLSRKQSRKQLHGDPHPKAFTAPKLQVPFQWPDILIRRLTLMV